MPAGCHDECWHRTKRAYTLVRFFQLTLHSLQQGDVLARRRRYGVSSEDRGTNAGSVILVQQIAIILCAQPADRTAGIMASMIIRVAPCIRRGAVPVEDAGGASVGGCRG